MSETSERSLGDKGEDVRDVTEDRPPLTAAEFIEGLRARRVAVCIRPNLHRYADLQRLVAEIEATPEDENVDGLLDEYEQAKAEFLAEEWWVVEQRSQERREQVRREAAKALGITLDEDGTVTHDDPVERDRQSIRLGMHVYADQVVEPEGVTADDVRDLNDRSPESCGRLIAAIADVQTLMEAEDERSVLRDFSSRRSGNRKARRSSKR